MFIDKEKSTCCCGCSLVCGIITYFVLQCLGLINQLFHFSTAGMTWELLCITPVVCLYFFNESWFVRQWNYIWQCLILTGLILVLVLGLISAHTLISLMCSFAADSVTTEDGQQMQFDMSSACENVSMTGFYIIFLIIGAVAITVQVMWVRLFGAYRDELTDKTGAQYTPLAQNDSVAV